MEEAPRRSSTDRFAFSLGIDVGKTALELALRNREDVVARTTVSNDPEGHEALVSWLDGRGLGPEKTCVCMEASGDFEKAVAHRLYEDGYRVSVVNPRRIKGYASSQLQRTKTDSADAALIARFGRREDPRPWQPSSAAESRLQELTRARQALRKRKSGRRTAWMKLTMRRFAVRTAASSTKSSARLRIWKKRSKSTSRRIRS
jgi:transposase